MPPWTNRPAAKQSLVRLYCTDHYPLPIAPGSKFPLAKYRLLRERVLATALARPDELHDPPAARDDQLALAHTAEYVARVREGTLGRQETLRIGFPWSPELVERSLRSTGATLAAARAALDDGWSANLAGGTHHAFADRGEGYCVFNDVVVAVRDLQRSGLVRRAVVIDCDAHQGNGTARLVADDPTIFALSLHAARAFPAVKETSDLDVPLDDGTSDAGYLAALGPALERALHGARADLAVYLAGADPFARDRFGRLGLTKQGLAARDRAVFERLRRAGLPVAVVMGGGYAPDVRDIVDIHAATLQAAADVLGRGRHPGPGRHGVNCQMRGGGA